MGFNDNQNSGSTVSLLPNLRTVVAWTNDLPLTSLFLTPRVHHLKLVMLTGQVTAPSPLALDVPRTYDLSFS